MENIRNCYQKKKEENMQDYYWVKCRKFENPNPGKGDGNMHYHEPDDSKWYYDFKRGQLVDSKGTLHRPKYKRF